ncbi:MAG: nicotinate (nicotinamide) nucleotide adenylyltransferase [Eubacteriales bacterium]|nr:nicotinate (nicotinamide) nucleotide adenylyltransferase [Eubacteriales bacterium]
MENERKKQMRIGILGGTFNPIHNAHVQMARISRDEAALDLVLLMVAADPPHKQVDGAVPASERYRLVQIALAAEERILPSDLEIRRGGKSYTLLTLQELKAVYPGAEFSIVVGSDMLADLPNWYHPEEVLSLADVLCVPRIGRNENDFETANKLEKRYGARVSMLSAKADMISSTEIRRRLLEGLPTEGMLPEAVEQAVYEGGEYFPEDVRALQGQCRAALSESRYRHVCGTMRAAADLAVRWRQDAKKARTAALLHDCAKCLDPLEQELLSGDESGIASVHHAFAGAVLAKMEYGVADETILRAIRLHTTGDAGMTDFDALVYTADLVEPTRAFSGVENYRSRITADAGAFMAFALGEETRRLERKGRFVHPATARAFAFYREKTQG